MTLMLPTARRRVEEFAGEKLERDQLHPEKLRLPSSRTRWAPRTGLLNFLGIGGPQASRANTEALTASHSVFRIRNEHAFSNSREHFVDDLHAREAAEAVAGNSLYFQRMGRREDNPHWLDYRYIADRLIRDPDLFRRQIREDLQQNQNSRLGRFFSSFGLFRNRMTDRKANSIWDKRPSEVSGALLTVYEQNATARRILDTLRSIHTERADRQPPTEPEETPREPPEQPPQEPERRPETPQLFPGSPIHIDFKPQIINSPDNRNRNDNYSPIDNRFKNDFSRKTDSSDRRTQSPFPRGFMTELGKIARYRPRQAPIKVIKSGGSISKAQWDQLFKLMKQRQAAPKSAGRSTRGGVTQKMELIQVFGASKAAGRKPTPTEIDKIAASLRKKLPSVKLVRVTAAKRAQAPTYKIPTIKGKGTPRLKKVGNQWVLTFAVTGKAVLGNRKK
ncbi:MAG: hypothetical protein ABIG96_06325 [Candidatus Micrarchaeota archaeon]